MTMRPQHALSKALGALSRSPQVSMFGASIDAIRGTHSSTARRSGAATPASNPAMSFPCLDALESRSAALLNRRQQRHPLQPAPSRPRASTSGPEPSYTAGITQLYRSDAPLFLDWGGILPAFNIAYETWGELNVDASNTVLIHTGLSASSHARSTKENQQPGWWESFIGPGLSIDTDKYFVVCTNVIGGCYGSTGPSSLDPADGQPYATRFPIITMQDMVRAQFSLLDRLGVRKLHASVGASMGGMQSLAAGVLFPGRVGRVASISGCARSHPYSIAMRHTQRQVLMMDPHWNRGFYYDDIPPHAGMKLAREIATVTYRSGPEWEQRFGRRRADPRKPPALCPDFLIETYLDHAGEKFCLTYDANSLLYVSKAMDLFDLGREHQIATAARRAARVHASPAEVAGCSLTLPDSPYEEQQEPDQQSGNGGNGPLEARATPSPPEDLVAGLSGLKDMPTLVMGVASDILFPAWQQREVAEALRRAGNTSVVYRELSEKESLFGHDTFLLDVTGIGGSLKSFVEQ